MRCTITSSSFLKWGQMEMLQKVISYPLKVSAKWKQTIHGRMNLKTPIPKCRLYWLFSLGWWSNFVGSDSGQKLSVKLLQNMVYNTTQRPTHPSPPTATHCQYIQVYTVHLVFFGGGGGGQGEGRDATVHKYGSFDHGGNRSQAGSKENTNHDECISSL